MRDKHKLYILIIIDSVYNIYEDLLYIIKHSLDVSGYPNQYVYYKDAVTNGWLKNDEEIQCVILGTQYLLHKIYVPPGSILMDFDHLDWIDKRLDQNLIDHNKIVTYSTSNANYIKEKYDKPRISFFKFGYSKYLDYGYTHNPTYEYDICFLGTILGGRREPIINILKERYKCYIHEHIIFHETNRNMTDMRDIITGENRAKLYAKSKIVLSIAFTDEYLMNSNASRIFPAVSTGAFVISERCLDESQNESVDKICVNVPLNYLFEVIDYYVHHDDKREKKRWEYYNNVKQLQPSFEYAAD